MNDWFKVIVVVGTAVYLWFHIEKWIDGTN
jgi:hypothetical protein